MYSLTDNITPPLSPLPIHPSVPFPGLSRVTVTVESIDEPGTTYNVIMFEGKDGEVIYIPEDDDECHVFHRDTITTQWFGTDRIVSIN